ncbi:hypothetical protein MSG28_000940 [Choristoneura fumiferana]|uniref:Uncharacterized protein n=1 Tax=Choristoneura fumiferana TaxID=7141 RepID=A0ACC0K3J8_CHOFU|nr:hypothetical protein MSG28_000940 [Choristoneura fumiferana]
MLADSYLLCAQYRYATCLEITATLCGMLFGLLSGGGVCYNLIQFGELSTSFVERTTQQDRLSSYLPLTALFGGGRRLNMMKIKEGMGDKLAVVCNLLGTAIICICQSFPLGWELTLACMTVLPFSLVSSIYLSEYQSKSSVRELMSYSQAGKHAEEVFKSVKTIVAFAGEDKEIERYKRLLEPAERYGRRRGLFTGLGTGFNWVLTYSLNAIGLTYGTRLVLQDLAKAPEEQRYVVGKIFSIMFGMYMATQSITFIVPHAEAFAAARGAAAGVFTLLERKPKIDCLNPAGIKPRRFAGDIILDNVHFSYPSRPDVKILKGFSLHVKPGENVALVGSSGCGKSTILQLLQRLYDPHSGSVKIDGHDLKSLNVGYLRSSLGVVGQEPVLFRGTIRENIAIGYPGASDEEIKKVAAMAYAHDFISRLPNGYETVIGERGASLSGGQKQRIAIARSLLREPGILLLDEATSALDPQSERKVQIALDSASKGRTTLTVSHRLSTIINADRIICMDQGSIIEAGTHDELMKAKGFYHKLVTAGKDVKEVDLFDTLPEETEEAPEEQAKITRNDVMRRSTKRIIRQYSSRKGSHDWMTPRSSICSVVSTGIRSFARHYDEEDDNKNDEEVKPVSDWDLLKLNGKEWPLLTIGAIAATVQGACFPVFAVLFGLTSAEIGYFDRESNTVGAICARLSGDAAEVQGATGLRIGLILQGVSSVFIGFILAICYDWKLTLVGTAFLPIMVGSIWFEGIVSQKAQQDERDAMESATSIATEAVVSIRTVQSLGVELNFMTKFEDSLKTSCAAITKKTRWRGLVLGLGVYVPFIAFVSCTVYGATLVANDGLPYSTSATGNFGLKEVEFSYPTRKHQMVLRGIDLKVEAGKTVALVGASGCGKSTVLQLLQRFYDPDSGNIELDGRDIRRRLTLPRLRKQLGVVQQEPVLFDRTLGENIAYGDNGRRISMAEVVAVAKAANIHNFIVSLPQGYDTNLGSSGAQLSGGQKQRVCIARALIRSPRLLLLDEATSALDANSERGCDTNLGSSGAQLSGGQKQRVCIARALIRSPRLLLLDEATSALDANSERAVTEALEKAAKGRTCITIAHRLSTIKDADVICVVDKGKIIEKGTHQELLSMKGFYYRMGKGQQLA